MFNKNKPKPSPEHYAAAQRLKNYLGKGYINEQKNLDCFCKDWQILQTMPQGSKIWLGGGVHIVKEKNANKIELKFCLF